MVQLYAKVFVELSIIFNFKYACREAYKLSILYLEGLNIR